MTMRVIQKALDSCSCSGSAGRHCGDICGECCCDCFFLQYPYTCPCAVVTALVCLTMSASVWTAGPCAKCAVDHGEYEYCAACEYILGTVSVLAPFSHALLTHSWGGTQVLLRVFTERQTAACGGATMLRVMQSKFWPASSVESRMFGMRVGGAIHAQYRMPGPRASRSSGGAEAWV